jgi:hypothetical protein
MRDGRPARFLRTLEHMDLVYIGLAVGFFALSWAFVAACDRL